MNVWWFLGGSRDALWTVKDHAGQNHYMLIFFEAMITSYMTVTVTGLFSVEGSI